MFRRELKIFVYGSIGFPKIDVLNPKEEMSCHAPVLTLLALSQNTGTYLIQALQLIVQHPRVPLEVICIDDASQDANEVKTLERFCLQQGITFIANKQELGIPANLNFALQLATGEFFACVGDDIILPGRLESDIEALRKSGPRVALVHSVMQSIDSEGKLFPDFSPSLSFPALPPDRLLMDSLIDNGGYVSSPTVTYRTEVLRMVGGWDMDLRYEDLGMWFKLTELGYTFAFRPEVGTLYRRHAAQHSARWDQPAILYRVTLYAKYSSYAASKKKLLELLRVAIKKHSKGSFDLAPLVSVYRTTTSRHATLLWVLGQLSKTKSSSLQFVLTNLATALVSSALRFLRGGRWASRILPKPAPTQSR